MPLRSLFLLPFCLLLGEMLSEAKPPTPINLVTGEWAPFTGKQLENYGVITEIVTAAFNEMGYQPHFFFYSWTIAQRRMIEGDFLATFPFIKSPAREEKFILSDPLLHVEAVLFYKKDLLEAAEAVDEIGDLSRFRIGRVDGYELWEALARHAQNVVLFDDIYAAFEALNKGEIDFLPESKIVGQQLLRSAEFPYDASAFTYLSSSHVPGSTSREGLHLMLNKNSRNRTFVKKFNRALEKIKESPFYKHRLLATLRLEQTPLAPTRVQLIAPPTYPLPFGRETIEAQTVFHLPHACPAVVLEWGKTFSEPTAPMTTPDRAGHSKIKILEGPLAGKVLYVHNAFIHLK